MIFLQSIECIGYARCYDMLDAILYYTMPDDQMAYREYKSYTQHHRERNWSKDCSNGCISNSFLLPLEMLMKSLSP